MSSQLSTMEYELQLIAKIDELADFVQHLSTDDVSVLEVAKTKVREIYRTLRHRIALVANKQNGEEPGVPNQIQMPSFDPLQPFAFPRDVGVHDGISAAPSAALRSNLPNTTAPIGTTNSINTVPLSASDAIMIRHNPFFPRNGRPDQLHANETSHPIPAAATLPFSTTTTTSRRDLSSFHPTSASSASLHHLLLTNPSLSFFPSIVLSEDNTLSETLSMENVMENRSRKSSADPQYHLPPFLRQHIPTSYSDLSRGSSAVPSASNTFCHDFHMLNVLGYADINGFPAPIVATPSSASTLNIPLSRPNSNCAPIPDHQNVVATLLVPTALSAATSPQKDRHTPTSSLDPSRNFSTHTSTASSGIFQNESAAILPHDHLGPDFSQLSLNDHSLPATYARILAALMKKAESEHAGVAQTTNESSADPSAFLAEPTLSLPPLPPASAQHPHPKVLIENLLRVVRYYVNKPEGKAFQLGWLVLRLVWNAAPKDFDKYILDVIEHQKSKRESEEILLTIAAVDLRNVRNLSAFAGSILKEYETMSHVCVRFLAGVCPLAGIDDSQCGQPWHGCPFVHPENTIGWNLLKDRWNITYQSFDYGVINYLCKQRLEAREAILISFSEMNLGNVKNLSAYLSATIHARNQQA